MRMTTMMKTMSMILTGPPYSVFKIKKANEPIRGFLRWRILWNSSSGWLKAVFLCGTENQEWHLIKNIARVRNCPDVTILNSLFGLRLLSFCFFAVLSFLSFCLLVFFNLEWPIIPGISCLLLVHNHLKLRLNQFGTWLHLTYRS